MLSVEQKRQKLMHDCPKYKTIGWQNRVMNMSPAQVNAIYNKFKEQGYFDKVRKQPEMVDNFFYQMTIYDYLMEDDLK